MEMKFLRRERRSLKQQELSYRFAPEARVDYLSILDYIANTLVNPDAAEAFDKDLQKSIKLARTFPEMYPVDIKIKYSYHKIVVGSYLAFYVVLENEIVIARILNSRQEYKKILRKSQKSQSL